MFDPFGMLNAYPGKSRKLLWQGYRDTERALREGATRNGRVKGKVPEQPATQDGGGRGSGGKRRPRQKQKPRS
jgi:hypothetical protein